VQQHRPKVSQICCCGPCRFLPFAKIVPAAALLRLCAEDVMPLLASKSSRLRVSMSEVSGSWEDIPLSSTGAPLLGPVQTDVLR